MMMPRPCHSSSRLVKIFLKSPFFHKGKLPTSPKAILLHTDQFSILFCTGLYQYGSKLQKNRK